MNNNVSRIQKVQVVVFKNENYNKFILLLKTNKDRGGFFQNITGSMEPQDNNNFHSAAKREVFEEIGIMPEVFDSDHEFNYIDRFNRNIFEKVFWTEVPFDSPITLSMNEHQDYIWKNVDDVSVDDFGFISNFKAFQVVKEKI